MATNKEPKAPDFVIDGGDEKLSVFVNLGYSQKEEKSFILNDETLESIKAMFGVGLTFKEIAQAHKISEEQFQSLVDKIPELSESLHSSHPRNKANVLQGLVKSAMAGNAQAALAWLYMKGGEVSPHLPKKIEEDKENEEETSYSAEERLKQIVHLNNLLIKGGVLSNKQKLMIDEKALETLQKTENNKKHILRKIGVSTDGE